LRRTIVFEHSEPSSALVLAKTTDWIHVDTRNQVGGRNRFKVFATEDAA
jgi:hypothetical protein